MIICGNMFFQANIQGYLLRHILPDESIFIGYWTRRIEWIKCIKVSKQNILMPYVLRTLLRDIFMSIIR